MNILRMINPIQAYAWGSTTFIQDLLDLDKDNNRPMAELWMGAHPKAPSQIINGNRKVNLDYVIAEDPNDFLGLRIAQTFNGQLPFLLKVLAASVPLSIQVHPNPKQAKEGFARENKAAIPLEAENRCYKDANHKPELIVALTPFSALCGFRHYQDIAHMLKKYLHSVSMDEMNEFIHTPNTHTLMHLYSALLKTSDVLKKNLLTTFLKSIIELIPSNPQEQLIQEWALKLNELHPGDIGILSPMFLNIVNLKPQQGLYLPSGVLHSYLQGSGIEVMANSDNVIRCGLTNKYISIDELLSVVDFSVYQPEILKPVKINDVEMQYQTPACEFILSIIKHSSKKLSIFNPSGSAEVLFCYSGSFIVENCSQFLALEKGNSLFIPYEVEGFCVEGKGTIYRAKVNI